MELLLAAPRKVLQLADICSCYPAHVTDCSEYSSVLPHCPSLCIPYDVLKRGDNKLCIFFTYRVTFGCFIPAFISAWGLGPLSRTLFLYRTLVSIANNSHTGSILESSSHLSSLLVRLIMKAACTRTQNYAYKCTHTSYQIARINRRFANSNCIYYREVTVTQ